MTDEENVVDPSHPRYESLMIRKKVADAGVKGMLADSAMIAHGRGEAFDYLLGEQTIPSAEEATREAAARLVRAKNPVLSLNGNAIALAGQEFLTIASQLDCPVEINIFYRTPERMGALIGHLKMLNTKLGLDVEILGGVPDARIEWKGKSEELKETSNELFIIFALALVTAFLVMAANFNSFIHPAVIMLTVPLSVFGGIIFILLFNSSINIFSQIALVILIGISTKNSILIVDWANQLRRTGKSIESAALEACRRRFRAIIMTSLSTMIAMLPLLVGNIGPGAGEGSRLAVGSTIFGGMLISTFFTLYVTPTMYVLLTKNTKRIDSVDLQLSKELKK